MGPIREEIAALELTGITRVAMGAGRPRGHPALVRRERPRHRRLHPRGRQDRHSTRATPSTPTPRGTHPLREELKRYHDRLYGIDLHPDRISVVGSTMLTVVTAAAVPGRPRRRGDPDRPLLAQRAQCLHHAGCGPCRRAPGRGRRPLASRPRRRGRARSRPRTKAIYVNSPSNPTGWVMTRAGQRGAARPVPPARAGPDRRRGLPPQRPRPAPTRRRPSCSWPARTSRCSCSTASPRPGR